MFQKRSTYLSPSHPRYLLGLGNKNLYLGCVAFSDKNINFQPGEKLRNLAFQTPNINPITCYTLKFEVHEPYLVYKEYCRVSMSLPLGKDG
jgi:hypothetical protein